MAGFSCCTFCAEVYRRYRQKDGSLQKMQENPVATEETEPEMSVEKASNFLNNKINDDDDEECNKLECMRAGWCMCDW